MGGLGGGVHFGGIQGSSGRRPTRSRGEGGDEDPTSGRLFPEIVHGLALYGRLRTCSTPRSSKRSRTPDHGQAHRNYVDRCDTALANGLPRRSRLRHSRATRYFRDILRGRLRCRVRCSQGSRSLLTCFVGPRCPGRADFRRRCLRRSFGERLTNDPVLGRAAGRRAFESLVALPVVYHRQRPDEDECSERSLSCPAGSLDERSRVRRTCTTGWKRRSVREAFGTPARAYQLSRVRRRLVL
jgi:hypothetical protein